MVTCFVRNCGHTSSKSNCRFFSVPKKNSKFKKWQKLLSFTIREFQNMYDPKACSCHFINHKKERKKRKLPSDFPSDIDDSQDESQRFRSQIYDNDADLTNETSTDQIPVNDSENGSQRLPTQIYDPDKPNMNVVIEEKESLREKIIILDAQVKYSNHSNAKRLKDEDNVHQKNTETLTNRLMNLNLRFIEYSDEKVEMIRTTKLVDLNDDCLNEIFGHLNVTDLCYVSRICKRLQELAKSFFKRKYSDFNFSKLFHGRLISNQEARDVLSTFGTIITSMSIQRQAFQNDEAVGHVEQRILQDVARYCTKELISLKLTGFCFTSQAVEALNLLSGSLTKLELDGSVFADCVLQLITFSSLQHLFLANSTDFCALMDTFPNLKYLKLHKVSIPSQNILHHFIARHSQLDTLIIHNSIGVSSAVARFVAKYMKNLREFHFLGNSINPSESLEDIKENFLQLSELVNLEYLALTCNNLSIGNLLAKVVANKISLKKLFISRGLNDADTIDAIVQMKYLEYLSFWGMKSLNAEHLIKCAKELTRLKRLQICLEQYITGVALKDVLRHTKELVLLCISDSNFLLDSGLYNEILDIVKERRNSTKLQIHIHTAGVSTNKQIFVTRENLQANENWLKIREINTNSAHN